MNCHIFVILGEKNEPLLKQRLKGAYEYIKDIRGQKSRNQYNINTFIYLSGIEAFHMEEWLLNNTKLKEKFILEPESKTTVENIINLLKIYNPNCIYHIITSDYHLNRVEFIIKTILYHTHLEFNYVTYGIISNLSERKLVKLFEEDSKKFEGSLREINQKILNTTE